MAKVLVKHFHISKNSAFEAPKFSTLEKAVPRLPKFTPTKMKRSNHKRIDVVEKRVIRALLWLVKQDVKKYLRRYKKSERSKKVVEYMNAWPIATTVEQRTIMYSELCSLALGPKFLTLIEQDLVSEQKEN